MLISQNGDLPRTHSCTHSHTAALLVTACLPVRCVQTQAIRSVASSHLFRHQEAKEREKGEAKETRKGERKKKRKRKKSLICRVCTHIPPPTLTPLPRTREGASHCPTQNNTALHPLALSIGYIAALLTGRFYRWVGLVRAQGLVTAQALTQSAIEILPPA